MNQFLRPALVMFGVLTLLTGVLYPLTVTLIGQGLFPTAANGSILKQNDKPVGSEWIGQEFSDPKYFRGRPSATSPNGYNAASSSGSNLGPTNSALLDAIKGRIEEVRKANPDQTGPVPADLVTASASGLDPHISPAAAEYQVSRVAAIRGLSVEKVREIVARNTQKRTFGVLGEARVNVLKLNLELDSIQ